MNITHLDGPLAQRLGWTLIHFLGQGTVLAILLGLALNALRRRSAHVRYLVACAGMAMLVAAPLVSFFALSKNTPIAGERRPAVTVTGDNQIPGATTPSEPTQMYRLFVGEREPIAVLTDWVDAHLPVLVFAWACGVGLLSLRLGVDWWQIQRLVAAGTPLEGDWTERATHLSERLGVARTVRLLQTVAGETPMALGWLRPVVLMPVSCLTGLAAGQLEAILAHELAHIRRHDYLVNLLQSIAETLLFYHPAVWWVSAQIRKEREHCCDDLAVAACGDAVGYAKALASLETLRSVPGRLALAANDGPLLARIRRVLGRPQSTSGVGLPVALIITLTLLLALARAATGQSAGGAAVLTPVTPLSAPPAEEQTPSQSSTPQVLLEVKFIELGPADVKATGLASVLQSFRESSPLFVTNRSGILQGPATFTNGMSLFEQPWMRGVESVVRGSSGVLTDPQMRVLLRAFEQRTRVSILAAPRVTTLSGRQAQVQTLDLRNTVSGLTAGETNIFSTTAIPVGTSVDVIPSIADDGNNVQITVIPGLTAFLGYEAPGPFQIQSDDGGKPLRAQLPLPRFHASQTLASVVVPDGQTAVISGFRNLTPPSKSKKRAVDNQVVIFITPTLIDATGRRIHEQ
jgi:beta-lactamase regulating signal transducer with metallopeptidase domain